MSYASRKDPEFMSLRMVACPECGLLYAPRIPSSGFLAHAYAETGYDSDSAARFAAASYADAVAARLSRLPDLGSALEIGCGNGALLAHLIRLGFTSVTGVEPSREAAEAADSALRRCIRVEAFDPARLPAGQFSLVIANQTLEHVDQPAEVIAAAHRLLKPGGALMIVSHDYQHWLMRLLGAHSPIIDIEHLQIFSRSSLERLLTRAGFAPVSIEAFGNCYPLHYWFRLLPVPALLKRPLGPALRTGWLAPVGRLTLAASIGNMIAWAQVPSGDTPIS
jgi:SAM-dependent methyltransferase